MDRLNYVELADGESQYDRIKFIPGCAVDAIYISSPLNVERGNRLIEVLPPPRIKMSAWLNAYSRGIEGYETDPSKKSDFQIFREICHLRDIRFPLPFALDLEMDFYRALAESYNSRYIIRGDKYTVRIKDEVCSQACNTLPKRGGAVIGFSLIGKSQTGKTSTMKILTSRYPPLIRHSLEDGSIFYQIPYIIAESQIRASIRGVYRSIGHAIDSVCGNEIPYYETMFGGSKTSVAMQEQKLRSIINSLNIGVIVFEEIQNMNFDSQDEKSFESFLTLCNETGVALVVVGTEDARNKMFQFRERTGHRVGPEIRSDLYCDNITFMYEIVSRLTSYQWFDSEFTIDKGTSKALLKYSCGIIGLLVRLYMYICLDYAKYDNDAEDKPTVDEDYVKKIVERRFTGITTLLKNHSTGLSDEDIQKFADKLDIELASAEDQRKIMEDMANQSTQMIRNRRLKDFIVNRVLEYDDYDERVVHQIIDNCLSNGSFDGKEDVKCLRIVLEKLREPGGKATGTKVNAAGDENQPQSSSSATSEENQPKKPEKPKRTRSRRNKDSDTDKGTDTDTKSQQNIEKMREELGKRIHRDTHNPSDT